MIGAPWRGLGLGLALACAALACRDKPAGPAHVEIVVGAAASLRGVLPAMKERYERDHPGARVTVTYGASGELRQDVVGGAPIDVVALAGAAPVDDLVARGLADGSTRAVVATNTLVLVGPRGCAPLTFATLADAPAGEKIAIGDPRTVPAGQYAKAALERLHTWDAVAPRLVYGSDVSAVLAYARRGEVAAAVVYKTELPGADVTLLDEVAPGIAPRAEVVVAIVTSTRARDASLAWLALLEGPEARALFDAQGFGRP